MIATLSNIFPLSAFGFTAGGDSPLIIIFCFVIVVVAIGSITKWQRDKLWHDTARMALEKGQPVPPLPDPRAWKKYRRYRRSRCFPRGIVLIAVGLGLYFVQPEGLGRWWIIPLFIGVAQLAVGLVAYAVGDRDDGPNDPSLPPK